MRPQSLFLTIALPLMLFSGACNKQPDLKSNAVELEKAFSAPAAAAAGQADPTTFAQTSPAEAQDRIKAALAAARADDFASGVIALEAAQRKAGVTADQVMAVQRTLQAMTTDLVTRAANGDQKALAQLKAIEKTHSQ